MTEADRSYRPTEKAKRRLTLLHDQVDGMVEDRIRNTKMPEGLSVSCRKGCAHCCELLTTIAPYEAIPMVEYFVNRYGFAAFQALKPRIFEQSKRLLEDDCGVDSWWEERRTCVFLDADKTCSVYPVRPSSCRTLVVVTPAEQCGTRGGNQLTCAVDTSDAQSMWVDASAELQQEFESTPGIVPLPIGVMWAYMQLTDGPDALRADLKGTPFGDDLTATAFWAKLEMSDGKTYRIKDGRIQCLFCKQVSDDPADVRDLRCSRCDTDHKQATAEMGALMAAVAERRA